MSLYETPGRAPPYELQTSLSHLPLFAGANADGWTPVSLRWSGGAVVSGWIRSDELGPPRPAPPEPARRPPAEAAVLGVLRGGLGIFGRPQTRTSSPVAAATIRSGAPVFRGRGLGRWATVIESDGYRVQPMGQDWFVIVEARGVHLPSDRFSRGLLGRRRRPGLAQQTAWVRSADVTLLRTTDSSSP